MRLLLVEDDPMLGKATQVALRQAGYTVDWVQSGEDAEEALAHHTHDLMILDINLPGKSGLDVLTGLRLAQQTLPVIALTARDTKAQRVEGLDRGADDYLVKPYEVEELLARIRALLRRAKGRAAPTLEHGDIILDITGKTASFRGRPVSLSAKEFAILYILLEHAGRVISRQQIEDKLYGWDMEVESNTIEVHISHLRKKLGDKLIKTIRGLGYIVEKIA